MSDSVTIQDTVDLAFDVFGEEHAPALIVIHGFFASARNWRTFAKYLAKEYRVFVVDMRNHGASPQAQVMNYPLMTDDLLQFIQQQKLDRPHILGHSMGGKIAMWLALNYVDKLGKLIIADISPTQYSHCFNHTIQALKSLPLHELSNRKQADTFLAGAIKEPDYRQFLLQNLLLIDGHYQWRVNLDFFLQNAPYIVGFPETTHAQFYAGETLFLGGEHSDYIHPQDVERLFPKAAIHTIQQASHWLHVQNPKQFIDEVVNFLKG